MEECKIKNLYNLDETIAKDLLEKFTYPWEVLPNIAEYIIELGNKLDKEKYEKKGEDIWIAKSANVYPSAYIKGPAIIGENAEIRHCSFIRGKVIVGNGAVVGNSTELKNVILFNKVQVPHYNYVGDSILGYKSHMGAGSITSNVKSDKKLVVIKGKNEKIETGIKKIGAMIGDNVEVEIVPRDFGRIAAQTAKQVIIQKLRETERNIVFNEYNERKGEIVSGLVQKADKHIVVLDLGKLEGIMLPKDQIPTEHYKVNDKIKGYVVDVERGEKGAPQAIVSRTHPDFVRKLLEFEIPEIYEGLIEIKSVSRDPGSRSKVAVYSPNENIDPVGSCVGQRGVRIQNVINELHGEKIDIIEWNADPSIFISSALLPAQIMAVDIKEEEKFAQVIVPDDQLSLAIGKAGQNARLAAKLTNWKIDIKSESQFREMLSKKEEDSKENN